MPKVCLQGPRVMAGVGEGEAAGVPKHVGMRLEIEARFRAGPLYHLGEAGSRHEETNRTSLRNRLSAGPLSSRTRAGLQACRRDADDMEARVLTYRVADDHLPEIDCRASPTRPPFQQ
jgi:hypothetical protein